MRSLRHSTCLQPGRARNEHSQPQLQSRSSRSSRDFLGNLASPLDLVAVLGGESLDFGLRLGDVDAGVLPVVTASRALVGRFFAKPFAVEAVNNQALHSENSVHFRNFNVPIIGNYAGLAKRV